MIDSISSGMMPMPPRQNGNDTPLTDDQKQLISETLKQYDANNLTETDAQSIVTAFSEAGIQPGKALMEAMATEGFDARTVGEAAGLQGQPPGPPPGQGNQGGLNVDPERLDELVNLLDQYLHDEMSDAERQSTLDSIRETLIPEAGLFNDKA